MTEKSPENLKTDPEKQDDKSKLNESDFENTLEKVKKKITPCMNSSSVFFYGILIAMFVVGWISLNSCTINGMIPVYLIVAGAAGIVTNILIKTNNQHLFNLLIVMVLFDFIWHGLGTYWVYTVYQPNYDSLNGLYCNRNAYLLAFWMLTIQSTLFGLALLLATCYLMMRGDFRQQ